VKVKRLARRGYRRSGTAVTVFLNGGAPDVMT
jgi:hypothetical protein